MKKIILLSAFFLIGMNVAQAKKIKFAVDMGTFTISTLGIHVMGDFQTIAGYAGGDFNPATTTLTQEGTSTIYSIVLNLPAFQKYEFKFVNGDQSYESEFVPEESRVGYSFNDNRWVYLDSLQNDTTKMGSILFGGNAPVGKTLIRFVVDMQNVSPISANGVHVAGPFQGSDPATTRMYSFGNSIYEIIAYVNSTGTWKCKYYNGNTGANSESVPANCADNGLRSNNLLGDSILITVCYDGCVACVPSGVKKNQIEYQSLKLFPNPSKEQVTIQLKEMEKGDKLTMTDITGKIVMEKLIIENSNEINLDISAFKSGVYQLYYNNNKSIKHSKLIIN